MRRKAHRHRHRGGEIWALATDAEAALLDSLDTSYHLGRAGKALDEFGVTDFATTFAPRPPMTTATGGRWV